MTLSAEKCDYRDDVFCVHFCLHSPFQFTELCTQSLGSDFGNGSSEIIGPGPRASLIQPCVKEYGRFQCLPAHARAHRNS